MDYARRRKALMEQLGNGAMVLRTAPERRRSNDTFYPFRPDSDLLYLTGFPEPDAVLVLAPGHPEHEVVLFTLPRDKEREIWDGFRYGPEGAVSEFGVDAAFNLSELDEKLPGLLSGRESVYWPLSENPEFDATMISAMRKLGASRRKPDRAPKAIRNPRPLIHRMRMIKDADELALMQRSADVAAAAHVAAMKATRAGVNEFELDALMTQVFRKAGGTGPSYSSIVAGGASACCLHYTENNKVLQNGDLVLVDAGCELDWYASDITRTWPVGTTFSGPQRDIYQLVLDAEIAGIADTVVGMTNHEQQQRAARRLTTGLVDLGLLVGEVDGLMETEAYKKFYMHGIGHYLGLDVHDVGVYYVDDEVGEPYAPGTVITVEPGIYVPVDDETIPAHFRGIGVRIEDDVVVTDGAPLVLTTKVPKEIAAIEALRKEAEESHG